MTEKARKMKLASLLNPLCYGNIETFMLMTKITFALKIYMTVVSTIVTECRKQPVLDWPAYKILPKDIQFSWDIAPTFLFYSKYFRRMGFYCIKMTLSLLFLLLSAIFPHLVITETNVRKDESCTVSHSTPVLAALEKAVLFYKENGEDLNLDAYFGLRIAEGKNRVFHKRTSNLITSDFSSVFERFLKLKRKAYIGTLFRL